MARGGRGGRGGMPRGYMAGRGSFRGAGRPGCLKFDSEFDFESSNAKFDKVQIEKELKEKLNIGWLLVFLVCLFQLSRFNC